MKPLKNPIWVVFAYTVENLFINITKIKIVCSAKFLVINDIKETYQSFFQKKKKKQRNVYNIQVPQIDWCSNTIFIGLLYFPATKKETQTFRSIFSLANVSKDLFFLFHRGFTQFIIVCTASEGFLNVSRLLRAERYYSIHNSLNSLRRLTQFVIVCTAWEGLLNLSYLPRPERVYSIVHSLHSLKELTQFVIVW